MVAGGGDVEFPEFAAVDGDNVGEPQEDVGRSSARIFCTSLERALRFSRFDSP